MPETLLMPPSPLLHIVRKQARGDELTKDEKAAIKADAAAIAIIRQHDLAPDGEEGRKEREALNKSIQDFENFARQRREINENAGQPTAFPENDEQSKAYWKNVARLTVLQKAFKDAQRLIRLQHPEIFGQMG